MRLMLDDEDRGARQRRPSRPTTVLSSSGRPDHAWLAPQLVDVAELLASPFIAAYGGLMGRGLSSGVAVLTLRRSSSKRGIQPLGRRGRWSYGAHQPSSIEATWPR